MSKRKGCSSSTSSSTVIGCNSHDQTHNPVVVEQWTTIWLSDDDVDEMIFKETPETFLAVNDEANKKPIRIRVSDVALLVGERPNFRKKLSLFDLVMGYVYQGCPELKRNDEKVFHNEYRVPRQNERFKRAEKKLKRGNPEQMDFVNDLMDKVKHIKSPSERRMFLTRMDNAPGAGKLPQIFRDEIEQRMNTKLGSKLEQKAIRDYETLQSVKVTQSNQKNYIWAWPRPLNPGFRKNEASWKHFISILLQEQTITAHPWRRPGNGKQKAGVSQWECREPYFLLSGKIDGLVAHDDPEKRIVLEVKSRVSEDSFQSGPPFFELIQAAVYLKMLNMGDAKQLNLGGDRNGLKTAHLASYFKYAKENNNDDENSKRNLTVHEIKLDQVETMMSDLIIPRLYAFCQTIYRIRASPIDRWRLLVASNQALKAPDENHWSQSTLEVYAELAIDLPFLCKRF